jgi:hypothetical protein
MCSGQVPLGSAVDALAGVDVASASLPELQELVASASRAVQRLAGVLSRALGEIESRAGGLVADERGQSVPTAAWLRETARTSSGDAGAQLRQSLALRELPLVRDAVVTGDITQAHAIVLARLVGRFDLQLLRDTQADMLTVARACDPTRLAMWVRHLIATWCEPEFEAEARSAHRRRYLQVVNNHDGTHRGRFVLADDDAETLLTVLEPLARRIGDGDERSAGQRRADALVEVFGFMAAHGELPDAGGHRPQVTIVVPAVVGTRDFRATVAAGLDRHDAEHLPSRPWTGPVTRVALETALCDCRIGHAHLDRTGQVVSLSALSDTVTRAQRRALAARDRGCVAKGCSRPPAFCDAHHLVSRADGGPTTVGNLVLLCRRHHGGWHRGEVGLTDLRVPWLALSPPARARSA